MRKDDVLRSGSLAGDFSNLDAVDRRTFLVQATAIAAGVVLSTSRAAAIAQTDSLEDVQPEPVKIARWLTAKPDLSSNLVQRAYEALAAEDATFSQQMQKLIDSIQAAKLPDVEAFRKSPLAGDAELMKTVVALVGALYTGRVGTNWRGQYVAFEDALMYRPTAGIIVIPTYARLSPGYWAEAVKE